MLKFTTSLLVALLFISFLSYASAEGAEKSFHLKSETIGNGQMMSKHQEFDSNGCEGQNIFPDLSWTNPPSGTQSFAITVFDPDARNGQGWWHWAAFNINEDTKRITSAEGRYIKLPKNSVQAKTDFDFMGFGGACPPIGSGTHHYHFTIYALDVANINLNGSVYAADLMTAITPHILDKSQIVALYKR